ncbi:MAG: prolipoprotein diacylglyceryl transferase [Patescibacteria group bacterium]|nr:prolipoprotein diacylglyceryl transferase [Patescibacteria group bacterium]
MYYFSLLLYFLCFVIFLFCLYLLTKDDFVILRKNITMEQIFNTSFIAFFVAIFFARIFYVIFAFDEKFLNPLVFLVFPYFPGFSLIGAVFGGLVYFIIKSWRSKMPTKHILDLHSLSILPALVFGLFVDIILIKRSTISYAIFIPFVFLGLFIFSLLFFHRNKFREGSMGFLFLSCFTAIFLFSKLIKTRGVVLLIGNEWIILVLVFLPSLYFFMRQEKLDVKIKNFVLRK